MATQERNLQNRDWLIDRLRAEVVGPDPSGVELELPASDKLFMTWEQFGRPKRQRGGEEILWQDPPAKRYGAGILFPAGITERRQAEAEADSTPLEEESDSDPGAEAQPPTDFAKSSEGGSPLGARFADGLEDEDVGLANAWRPSAMGLTFLGDFSLESVSFTVEVNFATYLRRAVTVANSKDDERRSDRELWLRQAGDMAHLRFCSSDVLSQRGPLRCWVPGHEDELEVVVFPRSHDLDPSGPARYVTVCLVNRREKDHGRLDSLCFFQCSLRVLGNSLTPWIRPYPEPRPIARSAADEDQISRVLYRDRQTFALGHGCAADWNEDRPDIVGEVWTDCVPTWESPPFAHDLTDHRGQPLRVSMHKLAGLDPDDDGTIELRRLLDAYRGWIASLEPIGRRTPPIPSDLRDTARLLIDRCKDCLRRMEEGLTFLEGASETAHRARMAFRLANEAMLISQLRKSRKVRVPEVKDGRYNWTEPPPTHDLGVRHPHQGYWRAFQIAFLLLSLRGICEPEHEERAVVDLLWFPTGGGKTEAYLGLTAFTIFFHRLTGEDVEGCEVLMRYTLRLLTAQQFERAGLLFTAMEHMRRSPQHARALGEREFRLGMWVGGDATPNYRSDALAALKKLEKSPDAKNPFALLKCPWCHAKFGPLEVQSPRGRRRSQRKGRVLGYRRVRADGGETVVFRCPDTSCEFGFDPASPGKPPLPIVVIDEDLYRQPPNLVIGTVDKFAMLSWRKDVRKFFGLGPDGRRAGRPPSLIIQDELHLISGPLGSMVGAYEPVIEELCTYRTGGTPIRPKIVASTATIGRAEEQVRALYARKEVRLFPPSGLEASDSFFAREDRDHGGNAKPGRIFAGVLAPGHGSPQISLARVFAVLLQYPATMAVLEDDESERDPWWTLVAFFNSLRELGTAATLLVADARDYMWVVRNRHRTKGARVRQLFDWEELTSRVRSDRIPLAIQKLETPFGKSARSDAEAVGVCLASNIIEVGVDIDRLSLMTIVGQPKTTAQYIQVSSRVGRSQDAPGLVVVTYNASKPRDRSHYERFRPFHQALYAQVEPTSVTPFSPPAVERSLPSVLVASTRQLGSESAADRPRPFPLDHGTELGRLVRRMVERRVGLSDPEESESVVRELQRRLDQWKAWDPSAYGTFEPPPEDPPLTHPAGTYNPPGWLGRSWPTLTSLRNVDATCEAEVTAYYNEPPDQETEL